MAAAAQEVEADGDGRIEFPDGRVLAVNPEWCNPTNRWKVGVKKAFDLFTDTLIKRLKKERRKVRRLPRGISYGCREVSSRQRYPRPNAGWVQPTVKEVFSVNRLDVGG